MRSASDLAYPLTKPLNRSLVVNTSKRMRLLSRIEGKSDGHPTYVIGDPIKYVHKGNNKSLVV